MSTLFLLIILSITIQLVNRKNNINDLDENLLEFDKKDSLIIFFCLLTSFAVNYIAKFVDKKTENIINYWLVIFISSFIYTMILVIVNMSREKSIQRKQEQICKIYQALSDILGKVERENIDFTKTPFTYSETDGTVSKIIIDTSNSDIKCNEATVTLAQYSINKFFPELQWLSKIDYPKRTLEFNGLPKPPYVAYFPGSDYRPASFIPLGLSGEGEICWNMGGPKDIGHSSFINEKTNEIVDSVDMPSAPQCLTLGSTGGGKSIWIGQRIW